MTNEVNIAIHLDPQTAALSTEVAIVTLGAALTVEHHIRQHVNHAIMSPTLLLFWLIDPAFPDLR